jgi:hypothetical protein
MAIYLSWNKITSVGVRALVDSGVEAVKILSVLSLCTPYMARQCEYSGRCIEAQCHAVPAPSPWMDAA